MLYLGVRNKYCSICAQNENKSTEPRQHSCYKNWQGPSTAMEGDIIVEGFKHSITMHGIKYTKVVGDGDSSVYKKLLEAKPYDTVIEKIECRNHLYRNFASRLREISSKLLTLAFQRFKFL